MESSPKRLAQAVDELNDAGKASIVETRTHLTVSGLGASDAVLIYNATSDLGWNANIVDSVGEVHFSNDLNDDYGQFILTLEKPVKPGIMSVLTLAGFQQLLQSNDNESVWEVARAQVAFSSELATFQPWGRSEIFSPSPPTKSPLEIVRETAEKRKTPSDIRKWTPRTSVTSEQWDDLAFGHFAQIAAQMLILCLASEIVSNREIIFSGSRKLKFLPPDISTHREMGMRGFAELKVIINWVYEVPQFTEQRHALFNAEFSRIAAHDGHAAAAFAKNGQNALDGARLSYQLSLSEISREAIKAQGDLRKSVAEDTSKLVENTRSVASSTAISIATGVGLIAAKIGSSTPGWALAIIASTVTIHLLSVSISGFAYLNVQKQIRSEWRKRLYQFVPDDDYFSMVEKPIRQSEAIFNIAGCTGIIISCLSLTLIFYLFGAQMI